MKKLITFFIDRPLVVNLVTVVIVLVGLTTVFSLQKETFPQVDFDVILITTPYPGSTSEDVEKLVTIPIERELKSVDGIKKINAMSAEGNSIIYLEVEPDSEIDEVLNDTKDAVDNVTDLPTDVEQPRIRSLNNKNRAAIKIPIVGGTYDELRVAAKKLRDRLERIKGIAIVNLDGYQKDEIKISVDPKKLSQNELTFQEIEMVIRERNLNLSAGTIEASDGDISLRTLSEFSGIKEIEELVVLSNDSGQNVKIKDIAKVSRAPKDNNRIQRSMGERAIFLDVIIRSSADIIKTTDKIKIVTERFFNDYPVKDIKFRYADDLSYYVKRRLNILKNNGILGIVLVFGCLLLFLNFSTSVVTSMGAPIAFMASFIVMQFMGVSINLISMFALILVLGMLVDDSIIVAEHFYQKLERGESPRVAARDAAIETIRPVTATILTTMVAFGSLFFMGGIMGKFLWSVPAVVIICLIASWFECFFILPSHLNDFCRLKKGHKKVPNWYRKIINVYTKILSISLKNPFKIISVFSTLFLLTGYLAKTMNFELFPGDDVRIVFLQIKGKVGTPIDKTDNAIRAIENSVMKLPKEELDQTRAQVGVLMGEHGAKTGTHYGSVILYLTPPDERKRTTDEIITALNDVIKPLVPEYDLTVRKVQGGPPKGKAVEIDIIGDKIEDLKVVSEKVLKKLNALEGITSSEIDFEEGKQQVIVTVNDKEAKRLGVSTRSVALELRRAYSKDSITEIRESDEDIDIHIVMNDESRSTLTDLERLYVLNKEGRRIPIIKIASFDKKPGAFVIRRLNGKRVFSVSGTLDKAKTTPVKVASLMKKELKKIFIDYENMDFYLGGENEDTKDSMTRLLKSGALALMCIFFILIIMFSSFGHPLVIMSAIPLGMIGVVWSFKLFGLSLGFMALMGVVGLVGVVVNDSIVLVTFINDKRQDDSLSFYEAVSKGCISRLRPVLLTTITTVAGLLPVAHAPGGDPFLKPMALSFAYGLLFATFVTLIFVPCIYVVYEKTVFWFKTKIFKNKSQVLSRVGSE